MNIGIVGLGSIGGSLGLDLRSRGHRVLGVARRRETCQGAIARQVVDDADVDFTLMESADLVFVCTPIAAIAPTVQRLVPHLSSTAIITDVGSVKTPVAQAVAPLWPRFVPGHPMAGTERSGLDAAIANLFADRPYAITPLESTPSEATEQVAAIAESLQARVYYCTPEDHDRAVAWISHLPVMVAASLIDACLSESSTTAIALAQKFASTGFRDTSRVGGGNPELGMMMAQYNRQELLRSLCTYRQRLDAFICAIETENWAALEHSLQRTQEARLRFLTSPDSIDSPTDRNSLE